MEGESVERPCCQLNVGTYGCLNPVSSCLKSLSWHLLWVWKSQYVIVQSCLIPMQIYIYIYIILYIYTLNIYIYIPSIYIYIYTLNIYIYIPSIYIYISSIYIYIICTYTMTLTFFERGTFLHPGLPKLWGAPETSAVVGNWARPARIASSSAKPSSAMSVKRDHQTKTKLIDLSWGSPCYRLYIIYRLFVETYLKKNNMTHDPYEKQKTKMYKFASTVFTLSLLFFLIVLQAFGILS